MKQKTILLASMMLLSTPCLFADDIVVASGYTIEQITTPEAAIEFFAALATDPNFEVRHSFKQLCVNLAPLLQQHSDPRVQKLGAVLLSVQDYTRTAAIGLKLKQFQDVFEKYGRNRTPRPENILRSRFDAVLCYR